mmetsp:Transcript_37535/g.33603  ORF Transcript_37535/g.33603 Transcript_37535/m.33603 type:complete len:177 (+) Transcript_37535:809-1339(+)
MDFALFNSIDNMISYISLEMYMSPTARIEQKLFKIRTFRTTPYQDSSGGLFLVTVLFFGLFVYYFFQEFIKVYNQVQKAVTEKSTSSGGRGNQAAKAVNELRGRLQNVIKAIINHILNVWTLLDLVSVVMSCITIVIWLRYILEQEISTLLEDLNLKDGLLDEENSDEDTMNKYEL